MADVVVKLEAAGVSNSTVNSAASVDIQDDGVIDGIYMYHAPTGADALDDEASFEISFGSTNTFGSNDVRVSIAAMQSRQNFLTSGGAPLARSMYIPVNLKVNAGERIHMHTLHSTGVAGACVAYLYISTRSGARRSRRRR